jgi:hypothetical protein
VATLFAIDQVKKEKKKTLVKIRKTAEKRIFSRQKK